MPGEPDAKLTAGLEARIALRQAWFEAHPNQPMPEGRAVVERYFAAIEAAALPPVAPEIDVETLAQALSKYDCSENGDRHHTGKFAALIAAEYAALRAAETKP